MIGSEQKNKTKYNSEKFEKTPFYVLSQGFERSEKRNAWFVYKIELNGRKKGEIVTLWKRMKPKN